MWIFLSARSMNTMKVITPTAMIITPMITAGLSTPDRPWLKNCASAAGTSATIPTKISRDTPLPMPRAVICSPSHSRNMVPPTRVITQEARKNQPGSSTSPWPSRPTEIP